MSPTIRSEVTAGVRASWTVALGLLPLGLAFGLLVSQSGFAWWWTPVFSFVIYAGSMEFLAISLVTGGVAPLSAAVTGFLVNFRHIFYGLSYPVKAVTSPVAKAYGVYALTDETYAILSAHRGSSWTAWTQPKIMAVQVFCQAFWVVPGIVGALVGAALPMDIEGLDFALTALFVVLAIEAMSARRDVLLPVVAVVTGVVGLLISRDQMLLIGLTLYFVFLVGRFLWDRRKEEA
ncbi:AzlC family ABC transporter permease [Corynebacterium variabile]|uniref:AzlC family ABC transporter permease n=1 Tax=Corynebacterium variabile TaxID=1727 RepID=UPI002647E316|nr:AzlC family ABC transporter permease [Corynebacterium variabile]MDN6476608.1 AzlC family ABC transporter permease [Corynebacterium variabile]MDN6675396.1 AzlC family ABC transporter permease [Corynebacterium variabile]MDN6843674.1 AzlC family ABC transporter permease [Corynebacterium variabile]